MATSPPASCASPLSATQVWNYDVYLCFRGADTRKNFVDHLYTALKREEILTYVRNESFVHGARIDLTLFKAVQESRIAIVVFSENFAESSWCLEELVEIIRCKEESGQNVIPIFYGVEPSDVRRQRRAYEDAFFRHELKNNNKVESWRKALACASNISGWVLKYDLHYESRFIEQVVDSVLKILHRNKYPTKTKSRMQDVKSDGGSASISKLWDYDIYVSFRGEDTRYNFVDHLYLALDQAKLHVYKDESNDAPDFKAIEGSQISIIIFSKNYASSSQCLEELVYITECRAKRGNIIIPVYYHVDPYEVRRQSRAYGEAFDNHEIINTAKVESWRNALFGASYIFGWDVRQTANGYESKCIKLIVEGILKSLFPDKGLIGVRTRFEELKYSITNRAPSYEDVAHLRIPIENILLATNKFSESKVISKNTGFGKVYKGELRPHGVVAIKRLDRIHGQGDPQFVMEIALLSICKDDNIVSLVGFCDQDNERILVLKYECNGSLNNHLHREAIPWSKRLQICLDAANGLNYLHDDKQHQYSIVHGDVKSANILLDEEFRAKITDFGLSKVALPNVPGSVIFPGAAGTPGYLDPQCEERQDFLTKKSDVYSFGVVLFEVLCDKLVNYKYDDRLFSAKVAMDHYEKNSLHDIIEECRINEMNSDSLSTFSAIAYQCLKKDRQERPSMSLVVEKLEKALNYQQGSSGFFHDVYISFRNRDAGAYVVDDICASLEKGGVSIYRHNGAHSCTESTILKAIKRSRYFVIFFTKKFAVNSWYLDEVTKITESMKEKGQFLLPVFYGVSCSDVRTQKGYFGEAMSKYDTHPRFQIWTNALIEATTKAGLEYSKFSSSEDLVEKAIEEIISGLSPKDN